MAIRLRLKTPAEVRRALARIANMTLNGEIDTKRANVVILACNAILSSVRADEQQKKIDELEQVLDRLSEEKKYE